MADELSTKILNKVRNIKSEVTKIMKSLKVEGAHLEGLDRRLKSGERISRKVQSDTHIKDIYFHTKQALNHSYYEITRSETATINEIDRIGLQLLLS